MEHSIKEIDDDDDSITEEEVKLDIIIHNITSRCNTGCQIDFNKIPARYVKKSQLNEINNIAIMKVNDCSIIIRKSGRLICLGASSEDQALSAAKKCIEIINSWGINATLNDYELLTLFCTCLLPWEIQVEEMITKYQNDFTHESNYYSLKIKEKKGFLGVYSTGSIRIVAHNVQEAFNILEKALPYFSEFRV